MTIVGFGSAEQAFEDTEAKAFEDFVAVHYAKQPESYFSSEFVEEVEAWLRERANESQALANVHDAAENPPDRYSRLYAELTHSASSVVAIYKFHHINRRHAFSPDGWALIRTEKLVHIDCFDLPCKERAA